jgi:crotonobetainyl-CoA:carnitine CoA-transferase CaiB-like acyl-CoA transferase
MRVYGSLFAGLSANKRSIVLDLKDDGARRRALELAGEADVVIEGFRPGVADRLGVGYDAVRAVNPTVIYCSLSGLGQDGELALVPGHDINYQAWAGSLSPEGGPPVEPAVPVADLSGGMAAALGVCAALVRRHRSGEGERIDVAMADVLATWTGGARPEAQGVDPAARGVPGYGTFETADGRWLALGVLTEDHFWRSLCDALGLGEHRDLGFPERMARLDELRPAITSAIRARRRDELVADLMAADVPAAPVQDRREMLALPHFRERSVVTDDPWAGTTTGYPIRFARHPAKRTTPPPAIDEHQGEGFRP